jgi:hypothetical protein
MEPIDDHKALIDALGGNKAVSDEIDGCTPVRVGQWKLGNRIPPEYWPDFIRISEAKGFTNITSDWLMNTLRPRAMPGEAAAA